MDINKRSATIGYSIAFTLIFIIPYAIVPYIFAFELFPVYVALLAKLTFISIFFFLISLSFSFTPQVSFKKIVLDFDISIFCVFSVFILLVVLIFATAPKIPIIESLKGSTQEELSQYREEFLKTREGWEASLGYIMGNLNGALIPYMIAVCFVRKLKYRFVFAAIFLLYCISFLEKAYFLRIAFPIFFVFFSNAKNKILFISKGLLIVISLFLIMYAFSGFTVYEVKDNEPFFSIMHYPTSTWDALVWRITVVPVITALDSIRIFITEFNGDYFYGRTSSFLAYLTGGERINFERVVYSSQFGGGGSGNANSYFVIEAYVNFGIAGVILISSLIAKLIRGVINQNDIALLSIMPLLLLNLFSSGFIGTMLSGGYLLIFLISKTIVFKFRNR